MAISTSTSTNRSFTTTNRRPTQAAAAVSLAHYTEQELRIQQMESMALFPAEVRYEMDLYKKVGYCVFQPSQAFYIGNPDILASKMVYAGMSRFSEPFVGARSTDEQRAAAAAAKAANQKAAQWAKATGRHLALRGYTLAVTSLRDCDAIIAGAALGAGGQVVVFLDNALEAYKETIQANMSFVEKGNLLFVSFTEEVTRDRRGQVAWDRQNARNRNAILGAMVEAAVVVEATSLDSSVMDVAMAAHSHSNLLVVRESGAIGNLHLIRKVQINPVQKLDFPSLHCEEEGDVVEKVVEVMEIPVSLESDDEPF